MSRIERGRDRLFAALLTGGVVSLRVIVLVEKGKVKLEEMSIALRAASFEMYIMPVP
jgi:hypothetical protein